MRQECKWFESRTLRGGETIRKCHLDLAPDAPWRCPDGCPRYERRLADQAWTHGSLVTPPAPPEPASVGDGSAASVLDEVEAILAAEEDRVLLEEAARPPRRRPFWKRWFGG